MKSSKPNSPQRLLSFVLIAILLICVVGFAAAGWNKSPETEPDISDVNSDNESDEADENKDGNQSNSDGNEETNQENSDTEEPEKPEEPPKYYSVVTGFEISEEEFFSSPLAFVQNPALSLYGISGADITVEFPTENGDTRLLSFTTRHSSLWKVGSLMPTRDYITEMANLLGGTVISYGKDDVVKYSAIDTSKLSLDLSKFSGSYFIQNTYSVYTSADMVLSAIQKSNLPTSPYKTMPYIISDSKVIGTSPASSVIIPFSDIDETEFYYSEKTGEYYYYKNGSRRVDMLNGQNISYRNIFLLFANSTTYEKSDGTELVFDTTSGGSGYYISGGTMTEISWSTNTAGELEFKTLDGNILNVNKGNAYIGYYKSSSAQNITIG